VELMETLHVILEVNTLVVLQMASIIGSGINGN